MMLFGTLMALVTPYNKGLMIGLTFVQQTFFGWAQYESIMFTQFGVSQYDLGKCHLIVLTRSNILGLSGGLAGSSRFAGGSIAQAIYTTILTNSVAKRAASLVPAAAIAAGASSDTANAILAALPLGTASKVAGANDAILAAAGVAYQFSYAHGLKIMILSSLSFGLLGLVLCVMTEDVSAKMNSEINVYLENDVNREKNEFH
jgi:hypothetical protein